LARFQPQDQLHALLAQPAHPRPILEALLALHVLLVRTHWLVLQLVRHAMVDTMAQQLG